MKQKSTEKLLSRINKKRMRLCGTFNFSGTYEAYENILKVGT